MGPMFNFSSLFLSYTYATLSCEISQADLGFSGESDIASRRLTVTTRIVATYTSNDYIVRQTMILVNAPDWFKF